MAVTLGLSQIVKNEEHVIERMLNSVKDIVDYITIVDTGSTDNTKEVIKNWSKEHNIPCSIYDREFDNYENSRNFAMEKARDKTDYSFWLDADEVLSVNTNLFKKDKLTHDLYIFTTIIGDKKYTRNEMWKNDKKFRWYGPVHEFIVVDEPEEVKKTMSSGLCPGIEVIVNMDGATWKDGSPHEKYKKHAVILEEYINNKDRDPRWVFYTAQSYHDSSSHPDFEERKERLRRALKYYKERVNINSGYQEERFFSQYRIGVIMDRMGEPFYNVKNELLKAYDLDPLRGEPLKVIIEKYQELRKWNHSYLYSLMGMQYHNKSPYGSRLLFIDEKLYVWRFLELHANSCYYTNRKDEARELYKELLKIYRDKNNKRFFTQEDMFKIENNKKFFMRNE